MTSRLRRRAQKTAAYSLTLLLLLILAGCGGGGGTLQFSTTGSGGNGGQLGVGGSNSATGPTITGVTPASGPVAGGSTITINGSNFQSGLTVTVGGTAATGIVVTSSSLVQAVVPAHAAGAVDVKVTNSDGTAATMIGGYTYLTPVLVTSIVPSSGPISGGTSVTITGTNFQSGAVVLFGGIAATSVTVIDSGRLTATTPAHVTGSVDVQITDPDGKSGTLSAGFTYLPGPAIVQVTPGSGPITGGTPIAVLGTNIQPGATVTMGGIAVGNVTVSDPFSPTAGATTLVESVNFTTPPHAAGSVSIVIRNPDGQTASLANAFTYTAGLVVTGVSPTSGPAGGGAPITITGAGFLPGASVLVAGQPATNVVVVSSTQITAITPVVAISAVKRGATSGTISLADITVINPDGQSATLPSAYTVVTGVFASSASPTSGPSAGGTTVTITGTNFQTGASVMFGGVVAAGVTVVSSTQITAVTPPHGAGSSAIVVTNPDGQSSTVTIGFTFVAAPSVSSVSPIAGPAPGGITVTINGSGFQSGAVVAFGGVPSPSVTFVSATQISAVAPAHAVGSVDVRVTNPDAQFAVLANAFVYSAGPVVSTVTPTMGPLLGGTTITIGGGNFQNGATVAIGGAPATGVTVLSSSQIRAVTPAHSAGVADVVVSNPDGQSGTLAAGFSFVVGPTVSSVSPGVGPSSGGTPVIITGANFQPGNTVLFGGTAAGSVVVNSATQIQAVTPTHAAGSVSVQVVGPDGQTGTLAGGFVYNASPLLASVTPNSGPVTGGTQITLNGMDFLSGASVTIGGAPATGITFVSSTQLNAVVPAHAVGTVDVTVTNPAGQSATATGGFSYLAGPVVTSVAPSAGPSSGGASITITGSGFQTGAMVQVGGPAASSVVVTDANHIQAVTPPHAAGAADIQVTNPGGQFGILPSGYTFIAAPAITTITPNFGLSSGQTSVVIAGTGFQPGATVFFGSLAAASTTVNSGTQITAVAPPQPAGSVDVKIANVDGQSITATNAFSYTGGLSIASVSPASGPTAGGTTITIAGANFQAGSTVLVGGTPATSVTFVNSSQITGVTPAHAFGSVAVQVTAPGGQAAALSNGFTYLAAAPTITGVSPASGSSAGGTTITITGTNFLTGATVTVGGVVASSVNVVSSSQITAVVPVHAAGTVTVQVTNGDGQSAPVPGSFTYNPPPVVTSVSPVRGQQEGAIPITLTGSGFQPGAIVMFGGAAASGVTVVSSAQINLILPVHAPGTVDVQVINTDGQSGTLASAFTFLAPPTITSISPSTVPSTGGSTVTINGTGFEPDAQVFFETFPAASVTVLSSTLITAVTPDLPAGIWDVTVFNPDPQSGSLKKGLTVTGTLSLTSVSPTSGSTAGGTTITITGSNLVSGSTVTVGGTAATSVTFVSSTTMTAVTPAHAAGLVSVQVTTPNPSSQSAILNGAFTYTAPAPTITGVSPASGVAAGGTTITITGTNFLAGATVTIGGAAASSVTVVSATSIQAVVPAHAAGTVSVQVTNVDGQSATASASYTYVAAPTVTSVSPAIGPASGGTSVVITGTGFLTGATAMFGGAAASSVVVVNSTQIQATTPANAAGAVTVQVANPDGQSGSAANAFTYQAPPSINSITPNFGLTSGGTSVTISGANFQSGATVLFGSAAATSVIVNSASQITATSPAQAAGSVNVKVTNPDGQAATVVNGFAYNGSLAVTSVSPSSGPTAGGTGITITGANFQNGATVLVGGTAATGVVFVSSTQLTAVTPAHAAGVVPVQVNNPDGQSAALSNGFTYQSPAPTITNVSPSSGIAAGGTTITITGTNFLAGATVSVGGSAASSVTVVSSNQINAVTPVHAAGAVSVQVTNTDGQSAATPGSFTYVGAPVLTSVSPNSGPAAGGTVVTLTGSGFLAGASVNFGGVAASSVTVNSSTQITATTPLHSAGLVAVQVTNSDNQSSTLNSAFTFNPAPTVASVVPGSGSTSGGTNVTITGANLLSGATVKFGGTPATSVVVVSSSQITAATPAHASGFVTVQVTNPDTQSGSLSNAFLYNAPPTISSVSPTTGTVAGGTVLTITGTNFQSGATVTLGGTSATTVSVISATQIQATAPAHTAGSVTVLVTNPDSQSASLASGFTYVGAPAIGSVTPASGPAAGGTVVTISGSGFQSGATVRFGTVAATSVTVNSATQITATTPAQAAATVTVQVTNPDSQSGSLSNGFTYVTGPSVSSVSPTSGGAAGGTAITITGSGFQAGATVTVGGVAATNVIVSSATKITANTGAHAAGATDVRVINPDGQSGTLTGGFLYVSGPSVTSISPTTGPASGGTSVTISGSNFQSGATVTMGGTAAGGVTVVNSTTITASAPAHTAGAVNVTVTNPDGQSSTLTNGFTYGAAPSVTGVSPSSGPVTGATSITITGANFKSGATVSVGGVAATSVAFVSATQLTAVTPAHSSGAVAVTVTNTDGQSGSLGSAFTYAGGPTISNITPSLGPATLGSTVTISGTNFVNGATVLFGSVASTSVAFISSTQLQVTAPPQAAGTVTIRVTNPDGQFATASGAFTYTPGPSLSSITPNSGPAAGGTSVTIVGGNFQAGAMVQIGTAVANNTVVTSATQITATTPATTAGTLSVTVTNPDGQSATLAGAFTSSISFSQSPSLPTITGVSPSSGFPGTTITITGSNYQSGVTVQVGGVQASSVTLLSGSQIQASTPAHAPGVVDVQVTNPDANSAVLVGGFTYIGVSISNVTPVVADINGGTVLTITGTGFNSGASVLVGALAATLVTVNSSTQMTAVAPAQPAGTVASVKVTNSDGTNATLAGAVTYGAPPRIGIIAPTSGLSTGGTTIVISGAGFVTGTNGSQVSFGGVQATNVTVNSATQITVVTPPHAVGVVAVQVTNPDGASDSKATGFRYGTKIFSDGFESGSFVNWPGTPGFGVFAPTINSLPQFIHSGLFSSSDEYSFCGVDQPTATVNLSTVVGGSRPATTYFVKYAYIWPGFGETRASVERTISVPAGSLPVISSPPPATLLTQWSVYISTSTGTETRQNSGPIPIGTSFTLPTSGLVAGATPATGSACGASHQDLNRYFATSVASPGLDHFFIRGYVYLKAPEPDVTPNASVVGRKLMYLKTDPSGGLDHLWAVIVGPQQLPGSSQVGTLPFAVDSTLVPSQSFFSNTALNFNTWYSIEVEVQANTPGVSDGVGRLYVNGVLIFEQTGINMRGTNTLGISRLELGRQVDRDNFDPFHEFHFWDDVVIADAYIGP